jgi:hypothetical protein
MFLGAVTAISVGLEGAVRVVSRRGQLFVPQPSTADVLLKVAGGSVAGLALVWLLAFVGSWLLYWRAGFRNPDWEGELFALGGNRVMFQLNCTAHPPVDPRVSLGYMECLVIDPDGRHILVPDGFINGQITPTGKSSVSIDFDTKGVEGSYETRWYASTPRRRQYELTRESFAYQQPASKEIETQ